MQMPQTPASNTASWMQGTSVTSTPILGAGIDQSIPDPADVVSAMSKEQAQQYAMKSAGMVNNASLSLMKAMETAAGLEAKVKDLEKDVEYSNGIAQSFLNADPIVARLEAPASDPAPRAFMEDNKRSDFNFDRSYDADRENRKSGSNFERNYEAEREERNKSNNLRKVVPNFNGEETVSIVSYLRQFKIVRKEFGWTDQVAGFHLVRALTGKAVQVLRDLKDEDQGYEVVSQALINSFEPSTQVDAYRNQFEYRLRNNRRETPHQYAEILRTLASKAFSFKDPAVREYLVKKQFEKGQTVEIRRVLASTPDLETVDRCVGMVSKYEACLATESLSRVGMKPRENPHVPTVNITEVEELEALPVSTQEEDLELDYEVNFATGKFNPAKRTTGPRPSGYSQRPRNINKNQSDSIQRLEDRLDALVKALESSNMGYGKTASPSFGMVHMVSVVFTDGSTREFSEDVPTVHELMVLITGPPPRFGGGRPADPNSICWFCKKSGHRYLSCELFRKWLNDRRDGKEGPLPPMPANNNTGQRGN